MGADLTRYYNAIDSIVPADFKRTLDEQRRHIEQEIDQEIIRFGESLAEKITADVEQELKSVQAELVRTREALVSSLRLVLEKHRVQEQDIIQATQALKDAQDAHEQRLRSIGGSIGKLITGAAKAFGLPLA